MLAPLLTLEGVLPSQRHIQALLRDQAACRKSKSGSCVWSTATKEMAASIYLASPQGYEAARTSGCLSLPSIDVVAKHTNVLTAATGHCVELYKSVGRAAADAKLTRKQREVCRAILRSGLAAD